MRIRNLNINEPTFESDFAALLARQGASDKQDEVRRQVSEIIQAVIRDGDQALVALTHQFDRFELSADQLEVPAARIDSALEAIPTVQREALEYAAERVREYHAHQLQKSWSYTQADGSVLGQKVTPLQRAGLYVPGGLATYPSSVIMNAIPAKVAGVPELIIVSPTPKGEYNDMVLAAAKIAGVDRVFRVGGAQAIAALAYGTQTIPRVDKITGPGNIYVATAKQLVFGHVGIDMLAGPSEVLVIADDTANPDWVAMDMFAQAEHDEQAQAILLTRSAALAEKVSASIHRLLPEMERHEIIRAALSQHGAIICVNSDADLVALADRIAAEHLEIFTANADHLAERIHNAGAIFIGDYSAESLGDYCAGPNHVLPTSGTARFSSPLGVYDFQKRTSMLNISRQGAQAIGAHASVLARGESLTAHARSAEYRLDVDT